MEASGIPGLRFHFSAASRLSPDRARTYWFQGASIICTSSSCEGTWTLRCAPEKLVFASFFHVFSPCYSSYCCYILYVFYTPISSRYAYTPPWSPWRRHRLGGSLEPTQFSHLIPFARATCLTSQTSGALEPSL